MTMNLSLLFLLIASSAFAEIPQNNNVIVSQRINLPEFITNNKSREQSCSVNNNNTCSAAVQDRNEDSQQILRQLIEIQNRQERLQFIEANEIQVEHSFLNDASERFLHIENYQTPSNFVVGQVGAAADGSIVNTEDFFLKLQPHECPDQTTTTTTPGSSCFTIQKDNGQLFAMPFNDSPQFLAFESHNDNTMDKRAAGMVVFDSTRFEQRVHPMALWVLIDSEDNSSTVLIQNVGTGRRLFAAKNQLFGGSPGNAHDNDPVSEDQKWRHCVRYALGEENTIDCSRYI